MRVPTLRLLFVCLLTPAVVWSGELPGRFSPAPVSAGPLVFFVHPEENTDASQKAGSRRTEVLHVCDPLVGPTATPVWRDVSAPLKPLARVTQSFAVVQQLDTTHLGDIAKGSSAPLWPGEDRTTFLKAAEGKVYYLRHLRPEPSYGMRLDRKDGKIIVSDWYRARDPLCVLDAGNNKAAAELDVPKLGYILESSPEGIWAVTADEPRRLCLVSQDGTVANVIPFGKDWIAEEISAAFSPGRAYLALSILREGQDFHGLRELVVVDIKRRAVCHVSHDVPTNPLVGSATPSIPMAWMSETHLVYGPWTQEQVLDAPSGKLSPITVAQRGILTAFPPPTQRQGLFDVEFGKLSFAGDTTVVANVLDDRGIAVVGMELSPDARWAAFCDEQSRDTFLLDGGTRMKVKLLPGWSYDFKWLAAAGAK